jgi:Ala-tRNA(Pro) deacylase
MAIPQWAENVLRRRGVPFEQLHHREAFTAQEVAAREHVSGHRVAKVVVVMADDQPVELVLPASRRVLLDRAREALGARQMRLAREEEMEKVFADCEVGAMPPLSGEANVPMLVDASMQLEGDIIMQAGTHEDAIRMNCHDWLHIVQPRIASFSAPADVAHV